MRIALLISSLFVFTACSLHTPFNENAIPVFATAETTPVQSSEDAADDPAIWVNSQLPESSLILGTDKKNGLAVYNLQGEQVQFLARGRLNNVDLRQNVALNNTINGHQTTLAVATNRTEKALDIFTISEDGEVSFALSQPLNFVDPYGVCMSKDENGNAYAFANDKTGEYQQWLLNPNGQLKPTLLGSFTIASQPEGCTVQDSTQTLYFGEENRGIWSMPADASRYDEVAMVDDIANGNLVADVEGMDIYEDTDGQAWLVVSSQGDYSYAIYDLNNTNAYLGSIRVDDNLDLGIDGSQETDGLAVSAANLGGDYSKGLLVVQDGYNRLPKENQNFKLVPWRQVEIALDLN